ncbi:YitT family protein [Halalkalibacter urbisdiaboli]|uniref:YitT family protein n=1 Tax=Halalkalibacter urbisdiaboli TaxID=1960589 RepID=UPI000B439BAF|nr:YitT family protein [Halalkalibacter urbisdiaboli]
MCETLKKVGMVFLGLILTTFGLYLLEIHELTFGGTAGIATVISHWFNGSWSMLFFLVNIPFFIISIQKIGKWFTLSSLFSITMISLLSQFITVEAIELPLWLTTILAGLFIGVGVTFVLNNGSSLGGIHILAYYLDMKWGVNRGTIIFVSDAFIILIAASLVGWNQAFLSVCVIAIASFIIGRYKKVAVQSAADDADSVLIPTQAKHE